MYIMFTCCLHVVYSYEWVKDGVILELNARNIQTLEHGSIVLDPLTSLDEGYYQCRAINIYGTSLSKVFFLQRAGRCPQQTGVYKMRLYFVIPHTFGHSSHIVSI